MENPGRTNLTIFILTAICTAITTGLIKLVEWFLAKPDRVHKEAQAIWEDAAEWREEQRREIAALREENKQQSWEMVALRDEIARLRRDLQAYACGIASTCEGREYAQEGGRDAA